MKKVDSGGGWPAIWYTLKKAREVGGIGRMWQALRSKNACKTCALGMGGQQGGIVNEMGSFPEFCKKSLQAMAADMQGAIPPEFWNTYSIPQLQKFSPRQLETSGRLVHPVVYERDEQHYRAITWEDALQRMTQHLKQHAPEETFWYFSGRSSNEAAFLLQLFARMYGTNNVNNCSYYCHQASGVGLSTSIGSGTATIVLEDLEHSDLVFVIGGNPASNHPRLMTTLMHVRRRGGEVIVINPVRETGMERFRVPSDVRSLLWGDPIASLYVQPHIGGDLALLTGISKEVDQRGGNDEQFLREHCENYDDWRQNIRTLSWEEITRKSGVSREQISAIADRYLRAKNVVFSWTMGITHHAHGVENVQAIAALALQRGMVGRPHAGLLPIRGHSNVQGIGSMGVTPQLRDSILEKLRDEYGLELPSTPGLDTLACMEAADAGQLKVGVCLGGNLYGSNPDAQFAASALRKLKLLVYLSTTLNTGHAHGLADQTLILPVLARDEEPQPTTQESMFNFIRLSDGGPSRHAGPRSEVEVVAQLAESLLGSGGPIDWHSMRSTGRIREAIGKVVPGFEQIGEIDKTKREFHVDGRILHQSKFPTPSGRARLHLHSLPELTMEPGKLRLMTVRSEGQFNTVVYEEEDLYRGQDRRDIVLLHPDDMQRLQLDDEQLVHVSSSTGSMASIRARSFPKIRAGNALMYYPEANVLVPRLADAQSRTPAFKNILVTIEPMERRSTSPVGAATAAR